MKKLVIIGASAMGRETCAYARDCGMMVKGFLDSRKGLLRGYDGYPGILGSVEEYTPEEDDVFVCAVGDPDQKKRYCDIVTEKGGGFASVIHPKAYVGTNVKIEPGCIVAPNATITADVKIGAHVIVNVNASISHDCRIGDYVTICPGCNIAGWCTVERGVFMGVNSSCIPHVSLGAGVLVAAGAVVTRAFPEKVMVAGVPAECKKKLV